MGTVDDAIAALVQENERLRAHLAGLESEAHADYQELESELGAATQRAEAAESRVRELEDTTMSVECLDQVRLDVEARTIERCAKVAAERTLMAGDAEYSMGGSDNRRNGTDMSNADLIARLLRHDVRHCECEFCAAPRDAAVALAAQDKTIAALREAMKAAEAHIAIEVAVPRRMSGLPALKNMLAQMRAALLLAEGTEQA